jgi:hypothetical protein
MTDVAIDKATAFGGPAVAEQAGRDASEAVLPSGNDRPPRGTGAAGSRHKHDGRPLPTLVVINITPLFFDHDVKPFAFRSLGENVTAPAATAGWLNSRRRSAIRAISAGEINPFSA